MSTGVRDQVISIDQPDKWRKCLEGVPHSYWHTWECCSAVHHTSALPTYLYCLDQADVRMVCPFSERQWRGSTDICTPAGFSGFAANGTLTGASERWKVFAKSRDYVCGYFAQHPLFSNHVNLEQAGWANKNFYFDLTLGRDALLKRMRPNRRNAIWRWYAAGKKYLNDREALSAFLVRHHADFMRQADASAASFYSERTLEAICVDPASELVGVVDDKGICAVCLFTSTPWGAEAVFNVAVRDGRDFAVPLIWWGVEHYLQRGLPFLHLGGGIRPGDDLAKAKMRYGTDAADFKCLKQVYNQSAYARLCAAAGCDPSSVAGYFPPYRAPGPASRTDIPHTDTNEPCSSH